MEQPYYREDGLSPNLAHTLGLPLEEGEVPSHYGALSPRAGTLVTSAAEVDFGSAAEQSQSRVAHILQRLHILR